MKKSIFCLLFLVFLHLISAQTSLVFVYFKDKPNKANFYANPLSELNQKSLDRRTHLGISLNDQDAPIELSYIQNIQNLGFTVTDYSKWLNGVAVYATPTDITLLQSQSYIQYVESFAKNANHSTKISTVDKWENENKSAFTNFNYGTGLDQINQINLRNLHIAGYTGTGITIAVLDTGFPNVDTGATFSRLWTNNQIKGGYNFVNKSTDIYNASFNNHGTFVLGNMGGYIDGVFAGASPDANFYLYATEASPQEIPEEQLYWIEAAEDADRKGVDIITTSLGYSTFDDPKYNLQYSDMNGTTAFISRVAQIATEKGIFVLAAAGNSGLQSWHYIAAPADNTKVFTIGGVDSTGTVSNFSSFGPNALGFTKPDACARGTAAITVNGTATTSANGTSFAAPIAAGGVACLLQAFPSMNRDLMRTKLRETASLFPNTTNQMGYGILNFGSLLNVLSTQELSGLNSIAIYPNPAIETVTILSKTTPEKVEIYDQLGRLVSTTNNEKSIDISSLKVGIYYLKIHINHQFKIEKLIKK